MRNDGGSILTYILAGLTGLLTSLTPQDIMFGLGALVTAILGLLTYLSNNRRNQRIAAAAEARNEILKRYVVTRRIDGGLSAEALDAMQEIDT